MQDILEKYGSLLKEVDSWFHNSLSQYPGYINCSHGCSSCCRGLFDITLLDALYLKCGFDKLDGSVKKFVLSKSEMRLNSASKQYPDFFSPWLLNSIPEPDWDLIMPEEDDIPCVLLSESGSCMAYDYRPMTCRLNGIPMIDTSGEELFDDWCTLNFQGVDPHLLDGLRFGFNELFTQELLLFRELTKRLLGKPVNEIDTVIPAALYADTETVLSVLKKQMF